MALQSTFSLGIISLLSSYILAIHPANPPRSARCSRKKNNSKEDSETLEVEVAAGSICSLIVDEALYCAIVAIHHSLNILDIEISQERLRSVPHLMMNFLEV